jgi:hypothetical protein
MNNIRHISLFNEFNLTGTWNGTTTDVENKRNINCISLNSSLKYSIKNLSIDIGFTSLYTNSTSAFTAGIGFPVRFYLTDTPIQDNISTSGLFTLNQIKFNGVVNPTIYNYLQLDKADSSNQYAIPAGSYPYLNYCNFLELSETLGLSTGQTYNYTALKTNTVCEYNFFNLSQSLQQYSGSAYTYNFAYNDTNDFSFNSNNENNLSISIFPRMQFIPLFDFNLLMNYTINFDLIEENI